MKRISKLLLTPTLLLTVCLSIGCGEKAEENTMTVEEACTASCATLMACDSDIPDNCASECVSALQVLEPVCTELWIEMVPCLETATCETVDNCMTQAFSDQCATEESTTITEETEAPQD